MAFQNKNLSVIAYANGFTLWHYCSASETLSTISSNGYFNGVKTLMNIGDIVIINASDNTHACGQEVKTDISWHGERAANFISNSMSQGAVLIDSDGIVRVKCSDQVAA